MTTHPHPETRLMPVEPTPEMVRVGAWRAKLAHEANPGDSWEHIARETWSVMAAAAPSPQQPGDWQLRAAVAEDRILELSAMFGVPDGGRYLNDWKAKAASLSSSPQQPGELRELERTLADVVAQVKGKRFGYVNGGDGFLDDKEVWSRAQALAALQPEPQQRVGEYAPGDKLFYDMGEGTHLRATYVSTDEGWAKVTFDADGQGALPVSVRPSKLSRRRAPAHQDEEG